MTWKITIEAPDGTTERFFVESAAAQRIADDLHLRRGADRTRFVSASIVPTQLTGQAPERAASVLQTVLRCGAEFAAELLHNPASGVQISVETVRELVPLLLPTGYALAIQTQVGRDSVWRNAAVT